MKSPIPVTIILLLYLYFVLKLGPNWMKNIEAYNLKTVMILYNGYQVAFCLWLCSHAFSINPRPILFNNYSETDYKEFQQTVSNKITLIKK